LDADTPDDAYNHVMRRWHVGGWLVAVAVGLALGCGTASVEEPEAIEEPVAEAPPAPVPAFINLLPWGKVDFSRGQFASLAACNGFVRDLPGYSFYTTPERCEPLEDPMYCTRWQDPDGPAEIDCFKGQGGCEVELPRHDMRAENAGRSIAGRCEPTPLADAWSEYQASHPTDVPASQ